MNAETPPRPLSTVTPLEPSRAGKAELLLAQWSRGVAEIMPVLHKPGFEASVLQAVRRLVDFCFVMSFAYVGHERPKALGDTLTAQRRKLSCRITSPGLIC